jgi:hypothetical protein
MFEMPHDSRLQRKVRSATSAEPERWAAASYQASRYYLLLPCWSCAFCRIRSPRAPARRESTRHDLLSHTLADRI